MQQDPLELTKKIIACESVTPSDAGSLKIFADLLSQHGFSCEEINRGQTKNLWAKYGSGPRYFSLPVMWMLCRRVQTAGSFLRLCQRKMRASYTDAVLRT